MLTIISSVLFPGLVAILFRQTNVVWVMFMTLQAVGPNLMQLIYTKLHENQKVSVHINHSISDDLIAKPIVIT